MEKYIRINEHVMVMKLNIMGLDYAKIYMFEKDSERSCLLPHQKCRKRIYHKLLFFLHV